jgi:NAD(P)-dependent dehydrogenase (short-subunit alcohol dehydrogenase family)
MNPPPPAAKDRSLEGRVALVTGATSGIGQETAVELARRGAHVVVVGRDAGRAEVARKDVAERSGNPDAEILLADFASLDAVRGLAREFQERHPALHILVNNAGVVMTERELTVDGHETTLAVNHLAPFLLTHLLRAPLRAGEARIVNVASDAHRFVSRFDFDDPMSERGFGFPGFLTGMRVYGKSKLANLLFTSELARRTAGTGVTTNAVHPGGVATRLGTNNGVLGQVVPRLLGIFFKTPAQGAETSLHVATAPALADTTGRYFADSREHTPTEAARDRMDAERLWELSCRWTGLDPAETSWNA